MTSLFRKFRNLKLSPFDIVAGIFIVFALALILPYSIIVWFLFQLKCLFFWKQRNASELLSQMAFDRLNILKNESNESLLQNRADLTSSSHLIHGRSGSICPFTMKNYEGSTDVVIQFSMRYFRLMKNPCELGAFGFRINADGSRKDLIGEDIGAYT